MSATGLNFSPGGRFKIVQFTDLHWTDGSETDIRTQRLMEQVLDSERPDLVVLTGDIIEGSECADPARALREATAPIVDRAIPWASVFGNHDDEGVMSRTMLMEAQRTIPHCCTESGPTDLPGVGNYRLAIASSSGTWAAAQLYFFDSGGPAPDGTDGYAWITPEQIAWYLGAPRGAIATTNSVPALAFFHIPLPEFDDVWHLQQCRGSKLEDVCCPKVNSGLFAALRRRGDVMGVFVGHDHLNDFDGSLDGIRLCYGRATGYGGYGHDDYPRGARVILLTEGASAFDTWIRTVR